MYRLVRIQLIVLMASVFFYATYAFASSNSNFQPGGEGVNMISGWAVSNVNYHLTEDSSKIAAVEFDLDNPASIVQASINSSSNVYFNCTNTNGTHWLCDAGQESVSNADELRVIASGG